MMTLGGTSLRTIEPTSLERPNPSLPGVNPYIFNPSTPANSQRHCARIHSGSPQEHFSATAPSTRHILLAVHNMTADGTLHKRHIA